MSRKLLLSTAVSIAALSGMSSVYAATAALEEVIVTAQKTEESIQDIPIAIQALDASTLERNSINNFSDIRALVPSLKVIPFPTAQENLLFTIRGIQANAIELTQDTSTAVHINGVYIARSNGLNSAVADLERIEVLKGPQGTIYGRNATAGAINLITARPTGEFGFKQELTVAEFDHYISKTSVNFPITDKLAGKVSYIYDTREGFIDNTAPNSIDFGDRTAQAARFDLLWEVNPDITVQYGFDWNNTEYFSTPGQCMEIGTTPTFGTQVSPDQCSTKFKDKLSFYGNHPENEVTAMGHAVTVEWDISADTTLRSITGYREFDDEYYGILFGGGPGISGGSLDYSGYGVFLPAQANKTKGDQFSQEIQLVGDLNDQLSYTTGVYFFTESGTEKKGQGSSLIQRAVTLIPGNPDIVRLNGPRDVETENKSWAIFGQLTWAPAALNGDLEIIPGLRFTKDKREASMFEARGGCLQNGVHVAAGSCAYTYTGTFTGPGFTTGIPAEYKNDFSEVSPAITLQYHVNQDVLTYAKAVRGYKAGGTAIRSSKNQAFIDGFDPETLTSYEIGAKSGLFDQRLRLNVALFKSEYEDQQVTVRDLTAVSGSSPQYDIANAGESTYTGAELEVVYAVTDHLRLSLDYTMLDFEFDDVRDPLTGADITQFYHLIVPDNAYSLRLDFEQPLGFATLDFNLTYSYVADTSFVYQDQYTVTNGQAILQIGTDQRQAVTPSYHLWNTRVGLKDIQVGPDDKGSLSVSLWCKNLLDEEYVSYGFSTVAQAMQYQAFWGEPRSVGLDVVYRYE